MKNINMFLTAFIPFAFLVLGLACISVGWVHLVSGIRNKDLSHIVVGILTAIVGFILCGFILAWAITLEPAVLERAR